MRHLLCRMANWLALLLLALLLLAACGGGQAIGGSSAASGGSSIAPGAKTAICQGLSTVDQALTSFAQVGDNTTVGEVKATQEKVANVLNTIDARSPKAAGPILSKVQAANDELGKLLQGYPDTATIGETSVKLQGLQSTVSDIRGKVTQVNSTLKCSA